MVNLLHDLNFPFDTLSPVWFEQLKLLVYLNSNLLVQYLVEAYSDNSVCSLSNPLSYDVVVDVFNVTSLSAKLILF